MKRPIVLALAAVALFAVGYFTASLIYQADYDEARLSKQECEDELDRWRFASHSPLVGYWVEHCVDKWRPSFQEKARASCEAEAEEWRYGNEPRFDWEGYEEAIEEHMQRTEQTPECVASDEALRLCNEALSKDAE